MSGALNYFLSSPLGIVSMIFFFIGGSIAAIKAKRRGERPLSILFSSLSAGFITACVAAVILLGTLMVLWGMSISGW